MKRPFFRFEQKETQMRLSPLALALGTIPAFVVGFTTGQNTQASKFAKYRETAHITTMEWDLMQVNLAALQIKAESDGRSAPNIYFDWEANKVKAKILVNGGWLGSRPANDLRGMLLADERLALTYVQQRLPDVSEADFEVEFINYSQKGPATFAEFKNGKLVLH
jgi:hypothetical protein